MEKNKELLLKTGVLCLFCCRWLGAEGGADLLFFKTGFSTGVAGDEGHDEAGQKRQRHRDERGVFEGNGRVGGEVEDIGPDRRREDD